MKFKIFGVLVMLITLSSSVFAQDATAVTDEELKKYAVAMDSINELQAVLNGKIKEMVTTNQAVSAARYNELFKIINDETKLMEANATLDEIRFVKEVIAKREEGKREDLSLLANASMPELKKREKKWVMPQAFASNLVCQLTP